jgi:hypothetical protein
MCSRLLLCVVLSLSSIGYASEEKTTEATVKAVVQAEKKAEGTEQTPQAKKKEEADAVAKATTEVLTKESAADELVSQKVLDKAADTAKRTFNELSDNGVGTKAAAAAAAETAVATVDGAVAEVAGPEDISLSREVKVEAEKAAVAAGKAVADNPKSQPLAVMDAVDTVKKEEKTSGKPDLTKKTKGMVAGATQVVSNLPNLAEGAVKDGAATVENNGMAFGGFAIIASLSALAFIGRKAYSEHYELSPYMKNLQLIREEFNGGVAGETPDLETQYSGFQEYKEMHSR